MNAPVITIEEYLRDTSYNPDVEYIDGEIRTRTGGSWSHGRLQALLSMWFGQNDVWGVEVAIGVRTRVSVTRVRLPDVVIDVAGSWPETLIAPPLIVIEILSPDDSYTETQRLAQDYLTMGIPNIWLLDPETRTARAPVKATHGSKEPASKSPAPRLPRHRQTLRQTLARFRLKQASSIARTATVVTRTSISTRHEVAASRAVGFALHTQR